MLARSVSGRWRSSRWSQRTCAVECHRWRRFGRLQERKVEAKGGPKSGMTFDLDASTVCLDDAAGRGQAEADSRNLHPRDRLTSAERFEDVRKVGGFDPQALVADLDHDLVASA